MSDIQDIQDTALKILYAFEDLYFEKEKDKIFDDIFGRYFPLIVVDGNMDIYDVLVSLGTHHRAEFDKMVSELRAHSLIKD